MQRRLVGVFALGLICAQSAGLRAQDAPPATPPNVPAAGAADESAAPPRPAPVRWEGPTAMFGSVRLDSATKTVVATGWVNQTEGPIEVLACGIQGKVHESVFVLAVNPLDLQAAFLLAGLKSGEPMPELGAGPPRGDPLDVVVEWNADGKTRSARAESFVWNVEDNAVLPDTPWIFTGSVVKDGQFKALAEESLVVTYWDPFAIVNLPLPCGANDEILVVNTNVVPPYETPVALRFTPR